MQDATPPESVAVRTMRHRPRVAIDLLAVLVVSCAAAIALCGYFEKPHIDFFDFFEAADAFQEGRLAPTLKRAPVYPAFLAIGGAITSAIGSGERPPMQRFAEWMNAALLPVNAALIWLIARRWLSALGGDARLAVVGAIWFCCMPWGMYCTAHLLLEPLLVTAIFATVLLANGRRRWPAYLMAAVAIMVRYDVAGLVGGLVIADVAARRGLVRSIGLGITVLAPLGVWLLLTAARWPAQEQDHYLTQMRGFATFDPAWACRVVLDVCFDPQRLTLPVWVNFDESLLRAGIRIAVVAAAGIGSVALLRGAAVHRGVLAAAGCAVGYIAVHSVFPFQWERFGYPLAPLLLFAAICGVHVIVSRLGARLTKLASGMLIVAFAALAAALLIGEFYALPAHGMNNSWRLVLGGAIAACGLSFANALLAPPRRIGIAIASAATLAICCVHTREGIAAFGRGDEARHLVELARWIAINTTAADVTISPIDSVLRLYADDPGGRFIPYSAVQAELLPDILAECRLRGVRYLAWYDDAQSEHAQALYRDRWRLERFAAFDGGGDIAGLRLAWRSEQPPHAYVWELQPVTSHPATSE